MALSGYTKTCTRKAGGVVTIGLIEAENVTAATYDASTQTYSGITLAPGAKFSKYEFREDTGQWQENVTRNDNGTHTVEQNIIFTEGEMSQTSRNSVQELLDASSCGIIAVVKLPNQEAVLVGWDERYGKERPMYLGGSEGSTGAALADDTGENVTVSRTAADKANYFTGDFDALFTPTP